MSKQRLAAFDGLIASYYGSDKPAPDPRQSVEDLFATYYGRAPGAATTHASLPAVSLSLGCDDGEIIPPADRKRNETARASSIEPEEYVIDVAPPAVAKPTGEARLPMPVATPDRPPYRADPHPTPEAPVASSPAAQPPVDSATKAPETASSLSATEADILDDLQAIIRGQKIYDKEAGMVDRSAKPMASAQPQKNGQEIFDRIAQSMEYANAYDLGTVELENRFADFDLQDERKRKGTSVKKVAPKPVDAIPAPKADTADFIDDLDAIKTEARTQSVGQNVSTPLYDTGEHVLTGGSLYPERLRVGKGAGVLCSYGQIIAMADLYESVDTMMEADVDELTKLKNLIIRSTHYYEGKKSNRSWDVSNDTWNKFTPGGRYLKLAEDNYEHFSPATVVGSSAARTMLGDNKSTWERYHKRAIEAAQQMYLATNGKVSMFFEWPLTINAFGDHFLTDAFSAGHLINKEEMMGDFKNNFYNGSALKPAAESFFEKVASAAWKLGNVAVRFSKLESVNWARWHGIPLPFYPDINDADRFGIVLKEAAKQEPDRVANLIVKALHDRLNREGVEVTNQAGDGTWILPGDGSLTVGEGRLTQADLAKNMNIIRKAVQQSVDDINSPTIRADNLNFRPFMDGVWRHVPELTPTSQPQIVALMREYTDPTSVVLLKAAAEIISDQLDSFIGVMVSEHKLQPA